MTRPNVIFFGFDSSPGRPDPKVFLRSLLYSTSAKGRLIENMFVRLSRGEWNDQAKNLERPQHGLYFDWGPDSKRYYAHLDEKPNQLINAEILSRFARDISREETATGSEKR